MDTDNLNPFLCRKQSIILVLCVCCLADIYATSTDPSTNTPHGYPSETTPDSMNYGFLSNSTSVICFTLTIAAIFALLLIAILKFYCTSKPVVQNSHSLQTAEVSIVDKGSVMYAHPPPTYDQCMAMEGLPSYHTLSPNGKLRSDKKPQTTSGSISLHIYEID